MDSFYNRSFVLGDEMKPSEILKDLNSPKLWKHVKEDKSSVPNDGNEVIVSLTGENCDEDQFRTVTQDELAEIEEALSVVRNKPRRKTALRKSEPSENHQEKDRGSIDEFTTKEDWAMLLSSESDSENEVSESTEIMKRPLKTIRRKMSRQKESESAGKKTKSVLHSIEKRKDDLIWRQVQKLFAQEANTSRVPNYVQGSKAVKVVKKKPSLVKVSSTCQICGQIILKHENISDHILAHLANDNTLMRRGSKRLRQTNKAAKTKVKPKKVPKKSPGNQKVSKVKCPTCSEVLSRKIRLSDHLLQHALQ